MSNLNLKAIWIPIEILIDDNLSDKEKLTPFFFFERCKTKVIRYRAKFIINFFNLRNVVFVDRLLTLDRINSEDAKRKKQKVKNAIDYFDEIINAERPSKELLNNVLEEIKIYHGKTVKFELKMKIDKLI